MKYMHSEWVGRLGHWINTLKQDIYLPLRDIAFEGFFTMEHWTPEQAMQEDFLPIAAGTKWGKMYEYCWLKATITVPEGGAPRYALNLPVGSEATIFLDDQAFGTYRADWVIDPLHYIVDNFLPVGEPAGTTHELLVEAYAGHFFPQSTLGGCATGPVMPGAYQDPKKDGERAEIGRCTLGMWNEEAYQLLMDVWALRLLLEQQDENTLRADKIAEALEQFTLEADFEQPLDDRIASYRRAREVLAPALAAHNGSTAPMFYAIGNAHLDLAWLWPMAETHRKTARTFAAQLRLLEEYPNYMFLQSQPASYAMCRAHYPELYERVREAIRGGRWIAEGAMWAEPDTNMTSGESLIRQVMHGKRFFQDELGVDSQMLWLPDSFGYSAALPQILKGCGVKYLVTQKIFWSYNEGDRFPYHYFTWQGADGTAIDTFLPTSYTYRTDPKEICEAWNKRVEKRGLDAFLFPFGYGDGGGGPCRDYIEMLNREEDLEGMPRVKVASPTTFFADMEAAGGPNHTYVGELYFSAHRGVYTAQAAVKKGNRLGELSLREAEVWGALAQIQGFAYPYADMDAQWKLLLLNQFHDILPGSSIARGYDEAQRDHTKIREAALGHAEDARRRLANGDEGVTVFNSLSFARQAVVALPEAYANGAVTSDGTAVPTQAHASGALALVDVPSR
ncbi:MAG: alpha-mannosidase, partial [Clostridiales bacterium]|nr:alpha-mannosidase [Clostridiales bacterium]